MMMLRSVSLEPLKNEATVLFSFCVVFGVTVVADVAFVAVVGVGIGVSVGVGFFGFAVVNRSLCKPSHFRVKLVDTPGKLWRTPPGVNFTNI